MLGSPRPADRLDSTHICLNSPENHQKTSRTDSLESSIDKRPTEEGRKGREAVRTTQTGRREPGWWRRMLGSPRPADHLDSTHICLNNPENCRKTSRTDSLEPSVDERPTEEGRKGGEVVRATGTGGREPGGGGAALPARQSPQVWLAKAGAPDWVSSDSQRDLTSGML